MTLVEQRGNEILRRLPAGDVAGVEVGVWDGRLSSYLLHMNTRLTLWMVDRWQAVEPAHPYRQSGSTMAQSDDMTFQAIYSKACKVAQRFADRAILCRGESVEMAGKVPDGSLDFAFIDADHSYDAVKQDLLAWFPKLKAGGLLCGHDWDHPKHPAKWGVRQAVEEFVADLPASVETGKNRTWFLKWD